MPPLHHKARISNRSARWLSPIFGFCLLGCSSPPVAAPITKPNKVRVQAFTEAQTMRAMAATPDYLFTASGDGLDRWDLASGESLHLSHEHGLPGTRVGALTYDADRNWLWVATDTGVSRYEVGTATFSELPAPPDVLGISSFSSAVLAPARDGGVWVGVAEGLFYVQPGSSWSKTGVGSTVNALYQDIQGALWIATDSGLLRVDQGGVARSMDADSSCAYKSVSAIAPHDENTVVLLAKSPEGNAVLALAGAEGCATFEAPAGAERWVGVASDANGTFVLAADKLLSFRLSSEDSVASLETQGRVRLKPVAKAGKIKLAGSPVLEALSANVPSGVHLISSNRTSLFLAAGRLGAMEWTATQGDRAGRWFRRSELSTGADVLSVACESESLCYISTAAPNEANRLWTWNGDGFQASEDPTRIFGVLRLDDGKILSLAAAQPGGDEPANGELVEDGAETGELGAGGSALVARLLEGGEWKEMPGTRIETPGDDVRAKAIRQSPDGQIWVSLGYHDGSEETTPYGVAVLDLALGYVVYHRASFDEGAAKRGILPVPVDVTGIGFVGEDEVWLASSQGATRVVGEELKTFIESDGLRSELLEGVVCSSGGMVYTASTGGVGEWNGERWTYPHSMRTSINDLALGNDGRLWLATDKGLGVYDGSKVRRLDTKRGLIENRILDVESDRFGRIWALSAQGLVLVSP